MLLTLIYSLSRSVIFEDFLQHQVNKKDSLKKAVQDGLEHPEEKSGIRRLFARDFFINREQPPMEQ